jgi:hypothetical protein
MADNLEPWEQPGAVRRNCQPHRAEPRGPGTFTGPGAGARGRETPVVSGTAAGELADELPARSCASGQLDPPVSAARRTDGTRASPLV